MHRDRMKAGFIAGLFADFAQCGPVSRFAAVAAALSEEPFIFRAVMNKAHGLVLAGGQVEKDRPAAFNELFRGILGGGVR